MPDVLLDFDQWRADLRKEAREEGQERVERLGV